MTARPYVCKTVYRASCKRELQSDVRTPFRILYRSRLGIFRQSWEIWVGWVGAELLVGREVSVFQHGQNPPPCGVGDAV